MEAKIATSPDEFFKFLRPYQLSLEEDAVTALKKQGKHLMTFTGEEQEKFPKGINTFYWHLAHHKTAPSKHLKGRLYKREQSRWL